MCRKLPQVGFESLRKRLGLYADPSDKVEVRPSGLVGLGLFAKKKLKGHTRLKSQKTLICTYYGTKINDRQRAESRSNYIVTPRGKGKKQQIHIDARYSACLGRYINEPLWNPRTCEHRWKTNAVWEQGSCQYYHDHNKVVQREMKINVKLKTTIEEGDEIFISYGIGFHDDDSTDSTPPNPLVDNTVQALRNPSSSDGPSD